MTEQQHPERGAAVNLKYYPPGHKESVARLMAAWREAGVISRRLSDAVPEDVQHAIDSAVIDGVEVVVDDPNAVAYREAAQLDHNYRLAVYGEKQLADDHLERLAEPLLPEPPVEQWGSVEVIGETGISPLRVPFTRPELEAISQARDARQQLLVVGGQQSGAAREFWMQSQHFPAEAQRTPRSRGLTHRPSAIWGIMTAARAAEDALTDFAGTAWEPRGAAVGQLVIVRDLPDKLIHHKPPISK